MTALHPQSLHKTETAANCRLGVPRQPEPDFRNLDSDAAAAATELVLLPARFRSACIGIAPLLHTSVIPL
jgi:hypothetical protein